MSEASAKKDVQKLQRVIVDALEDVKAQDIQVFNTEHLSPLFERVVIASGTSNRQTKALSASVRDKVRDAGFGKPRIEGEDNGEWIIADCGAAVVHIMQPVIRQYYNLEEIWGDKPVRLKAAAAPTPARAQGDAPAPRKAPARKSADKSAGKSTGKTASKLAPKPAAKRTTPAAAKSATKTAPQAAAKPARKAARTVASKAASRAPRSPKAS